MTQESMPDELAHLGDIEYILTIIASHLKDPSLTPARPVWTSTHTPALQSTPSFKHLRQAMQRDTHSYLNNTMAKLKQDLFILRPAQLLTLHSLGLPQDIVDQVKSLNFLRLATVPHPVAIRLKIVASLPATSEDTPDWNAWWYDNRNKGLGIFRPQDHDPQQDPVSESLNTVIHAMAGQAADHLPTPVEIARYVATNPETAGKKAQIPIKLSDVYTAISDIHQTALLIFLTPEHLTPLRLEHPDEIAETIRAHHGEVDQDLGSITTLEALKPLMPPKGTAGIRVSIPYRIWHRADVGSSYKLTPRDNVHFSNHKTARLHPRNGQSNEPISKVEWELMYRSVPTIPIYSHITETPHNPDPQASELALLTGTTPKAASDYLHGKASSPMPPQGLDKCPLIDECASLCAHLQRTGELPFPFTTDGRHESCHYWQFLSIHLNSPSQFREPAAAQALKKQQDLLHKHNRTNLPPSQVLQDAQQPTEDAAPAEAPVTVPASQQQALF